jgi:hypothetical protein
MINPKMTVSEKVDEAEGNGGGPASQGVFREISEGETMDS